MMIHSLTYYLLWILVFVFSIGLRIFVRIGDWSVLIWSENVGNKFDYVIVGGGSSGSILAARLSENPNVSVVLIEAGGEGFDLLNIPVLGPLKQLSDLDWQYATIPQKSSCLGLENNVSKWPSGKILGGSTHLNYMIYLRGHQKDYLKWKDPESEHWDYDDINYYFRKAHICVNSNKEEGSDCARSGGSILVRKRMSHSTELSDTVLEAASKLNYSLNDLNAKSGTGFMKPHLNMNEFGKRWTSDQFLRKVSTQRKNLKVITNVVAEEILLKNGFEAYAVRFNRGRKSEIVFANIEIILSAGAVASPKLLMLSGIGPENSISKAKIQPKIDLPVGKNLQDHVTTGLDLILLEKSLFPFSDLLMPSSAFRYFVDGSGPYSSGLVEAIGVVHSALVDSSRDAPDLQFMAMTAGLSSDKGVFFRKSMGISEKVWNGYFQSLVNETTISVIPVLLHPKSRGEINLNPADPRGNPIIDPKYLTEERDVKTLVEGIRIIQKMVETEPMKKLGAKLNRNKFPGCESLEFDTDDYWACYVRHLTLTVYHPVGTCKMGSLETGGVVDYRLRVHKTNKLRVIDASVMPELPSANTNAAVVMIAEKGADLIKEDFMKRHSSCQAREILCCGLLNEKAEKKAKDKGRWTTIFGE